MNSTHTLTLRTVLISRQTRVTDAALVLAGAALVAAAAQVSIPLPFTPVPVTGQTFAVVLVGASLGAALGATSLLLYVLAGVAGAPIYADGASGVHTLSSATGGYLIGFIAAATLTGWLAQHRWDRTLSSALGAMLCGNIVIYLFGLPWLAHHLNTNLNTTLEYGLYPFIIGDTIKIYLAAILLPTAWRLTRHHKG